MEKRIRTMRSRFITAGSLVGGILFAAGVASAGPASPTSLIVAGDAYLNASEVGNVEVAVNYAPNVAHVVVRLVPSATCDPAATPTVAQSFVPANPGGGTESVFFDISDATMMADYGETFPEGVAVCAIARAGYVDVHTGQIVYSPGAGSANRPVKDTIILPGTVEILDPVSTGWLNAVEASVTPVGSPAGSIKGLWQKNATSDATAAEVWWDDITGVLPTPDATCGPFGTPFTYSASSSTYAGATPDQTLSNACTTFFAEGAEISFNARWRDAAGNISTTATTLPFPEGSLKKDTVKPAPPTVDLRGKTVNYNPPLQSGTTITTPNVIDHENQDEIEVAASYAETDLDEIRMTVTDGTTTLPTQVRDPLTNPVVFPFDLTSLKNCESAGNSAFGAPGNPPPHTPVASLPTPPPFAGNCIVASGVSVDLAGNESDPGTEAGFKDAAKPAAPSAVLLVPSVITDINDQLVMLEVHGEPYDVVNIEIRDEDPSSQHLSNFTLYDNGIPPAPIPGSGTLTKFRLDDSGFGAINVDVTTLADGNIHSIVHLVDPWGNVGPKLTRTSLKRLTTPSLQLTKPADNSINPRTVEFAGVAKYQHPADPIGTFRPCTQCTITIYDHAGNVTNYGNPNNIPLVTVNADANGRFTATYSYNASGTKRAYFRATSSAPIGDPERLINGRPSAVHVFGVDTQAPTVSLGFAPRSGIYVPQVYNAADTIVVRGTATDDFSGLAGVQLIVTRINPTQGGAGNEIRWNQTVLDVSGSQTNCSNCPGGRNVTWSYDLTGLPAGQYTVQARSVDMAGQNSGWTEGTATYTFVKLPA